MEDVRKNGAAEAGRDGRHYAVRRITPVEAERLQGFPDGWTDIEYKGRKAPDSARGRAVGNSMAVPVMQWIARRILDVEREAAAGQSEIPAGTPDSEEEENGIHALS